MRLLTSALLILLIGAGQAGAAEPVSAAPSSTVLPAHRANFEFHSAFLMNLHHFLFNLGVHQELMDKIIWPITPTREEMNSLRAAVAFYHDNYVRRDLLFDEVMTSIKTGLSIDDARRDASSLPLTQPLIAVLNSVAPMYARCIWAEQDALNQTWIREAKVLDARYGEEIQGGIEHYLGRPFPTSPIRIDVVVETGKRQGGYTDVQTVIPGGRISYQGLASLEMLYHETSHIASTTALDEAIEARLKQTRRPLDSDLWHALQFYTVGTLVRDVVKRQDGADYEPYADKAGLFKGYWSPFMPLIETDWRAYMQGKSSFQNAITRMVDKLPAQ